MVRLHPTKEGYTYAMHFTKKKLIILHGKNLMYIYQMEQSLE